jgi:hypothetical protein
VATGSVGGLDSVLQSVDGALTKPRPAQAGAAAIGQVLQALGSAPGTGGIAGNLRQLQEQLQGGAPDGAQVARLLTTLGQQTRETAGRRAGSRPAAPARHAPRRRRARLGGGGGDAGGVTPRASAVACCYAAVAAP